MQRDEMRPSLTYFEMKNSSEPRRNAGRNSVSFSILIDPFSVHDVGPQRPASTQLVEVRSFFHANSACGCNNRDLLGIEVAFLRLFQDNDTNQGHSLARAPRRYSRARFSGLLLAGCLAQYFRFDKMNLHISMGSGCQTSPE